MSVSSTVLQQRPKDTADVHADTNKDGDDPGDAAPCPLKRLLQLPHVIRVDIADAVLLHLLLGGVRVANGLEAVGRISAGDWEEDSGAARVLLGEQRDVVHMTIHNELQIVQLVVPLNVD